MTDAPTTPFQPFQVRSDPPLPAEKPARKPRQKRGARKPRVAKPEVQEGASVTTAARKTRAPRGGIRIAAEEASMLSVHYMRQAGELRAQADALELRAKQLVRED